ncbi:hypothetical protein OHA72_45125 [Dactylosporangium sp. NBC_01737]|uniref:hypothetical protein n=1 Tax=Dactylosporangium sp. NBC_01737 TaxID=2975959 RepID=UPI002E13D920|nr:hypothetical protein OHA72_45125 [Dactylosporangium sp. NBC_01737]
MAAPSTSTICAPSRTRPSLAPGGLGSGAHVDQGAGAAAHTELGLAGEFLVAAHRPDGDGDAVRASDGLGLQVDVELVLGEHPTRRDGRLDLRHRLDPSVLEALQYFSGAERAF